MVGLGGGTAHVYVTLVCLQDQENQPEMRETKIWKFGAFLDRLFQTIHRSPIAAVGGLSVRWGSLTETLFLARRDQTLLSIAITKYYVIDTEQLCSIPCSVPMPLQ
mmetsp:Transcript_20510/g.48131  ORF Transcript_20510/g.48131 Transcript_20510/m.48131 type:complete len:106 (+) Transcript_20510:230-547(+)